MDLGRQLVERLDFYFSSLHDRSLHSNASLLLSYVVGETVVNDWLIKTMFLGFAAYLHLDEGGINRLKNIYLTSVSVQPWHLEKKKPSQTSLSQYCCIFWNRQLIFYYGFRGNRMKQDKENGTFIIQSERFFIMIAMINSSPKRLSCDCLFPFLIVCLTVH